MFKQFIKEYNPVTVLSYCDLSWANGGLYKNLGFHSIGITKPNYYYVINGKRENRINYQKHKLRQNIIKIVLLQILNGQRYITT